MPQADYPGRWVGSFCGLHGLNNSTISRLPDCTDIGSDMLDLGVKMKRAGMSNSSRRARLRRPGDAY